MNRFLQSVDVQRLSGLKSLLGIDLTPPRARIVELKRQGNPFFRHRARYRVMQAFSCEFPGGALPAQKSAFLKDSLVRRRVAATAAVACMRGLGVRTTTATVPEDTEDVDQWIVEHLDKLLRLPVPANEVSFRWEPIARIRTGEFIEVTFVRNSDIEETAGLILGAGLQLMSLGAGVRDILPAIIAGEHAGPDFAVAHIGEHALSVVRIEEGQREEIRTLTPPSHGEIDQAIIAAKGEIGVAERPAFQMFVASDRADIIATEGCSLLNPFGLEAHFALAAGLAVKGFRPELSPMNFLPLEQREENEVSMYKALAQRTAIILGSVLLLALLGQLLVSSILQGKIDALDKEAAALGRERAAVSILEQEVTGMEARLQEGPSSLHRSNNARVLHDVASAAPEGVWLVKCALGGRNQRAGRLTLVGVARSNEQITLFLRNLQSNPVFNTTKLVRTGAPAEGERLRSAGGGREGLMTFEISTTASL